MAYNQISKCRFYVSTLEWLHRLGGLEIVEDNSLSNQNLYSIVDLRPQNQFIYTGGVGAYQIRFLTAGTFAGRYFATLMRPENTFSMLLGHTFSDMQVHFNSLSEGASGGYLTPTEIVNYNDVSPLYYGFSIAEGSDTNNSSLAIGNVIRLFFKNGEQQIGHDLGWQIGSVLFGNYWETPHSPDLNLSISFETGTKTIETKGGASLSNTLWDAPPKWGAAGAWQLYEPDSPPNPIERKGRRIFDLNFSFLSQSDTFPKYASGTALPHTVGVNETYSTLDDEVVDTMVASDDFYSRVISKVGSHSPFVFQYNVDTNDDGSADPNTFAICKFDQKGFKISQTSPNLYSCKVRIRECW